MSSTAENDFRALLVSYAPLAGMVGKRVAQNGVPEGSALPYVVFTTTHDPIRGLNGAQQADQVTISCECWAINALAADAVADAVEAALAFAPPMAGATVTARASGYDGEMGLDATVLTVEWWTD